MLNRFEPFTDFDRFSSELFGALSRRAIPMPIDAFRRGDHWVVRVDLPGVDANSIDLTVERNVLRIEATRNWQPEEGDVVLASERPRGTFARQLMLSEDIETAAIQADYRDGVLSVKLPVAEAAKPKKVLVSTEGAKEARPVEAQSAEHQAA